MLPSSPNWSGAGGAVAEIWRMLRLHERMVKNMKTINDKSLQMFVMLACLNQQYRYSKRQSPEPTKTGLNSQIWYFTYDLFDTRIWYLKQENDNVTW